jgi:Ran GTPase-activating protein (RanGAP) involved in mRNA processing and transport
MKRFFSKVGVRGLDSKLTRLISSRKGQRDPPDSDGGDPEYHYFSDCPIPVEDIQYIYKRKCYQLEIPLNEEAEGKFVEEFVKRIHPKSVRFTGLGLGIFGLGALLDSLVRFDRFICLDLGLNNLGDWGAYMLSKYLEMRPNVIHLDIRSNGIEAEGLRHIICAIMNNQYIVSVDFSGVEGIERNRLGIAGCRDLSFFLRRSAVIAHLNISACGIGIPGCRFIGNALYRNESLRSIDLSFNGFGCEGLIGLSDLPGTFKAVERLALVRNNLGNQCAQTFCKQLENSSMRNLDLSKNHIGKPFLKELVNVFQNGSVLDTLSLAENKLGPGCGVLLHLLIRDGPSLTALDLSMNRLTDSAVIQIAEALLENMTLVTVNLSETGVTDASAIKFAPVLARRSSLQELFLNSNRITDVAGVELARSLSVNSTLTTFGLKDNELGDSTAEILLDSLRKNETLMTLTVDLNHFSHRLHGELKDAIAEHKKNLTLNFHKIADRHIEHLQTEENKLFELMEECEIQQKVKEEETYDLEWKKESLEKLVTSREKDLAEGAAKLEKLKAEYSEVSGQRRQKEVEFKELKLKTQEEYGDVLTILHGWQSKRHLAQTRMRRVDAKRQKAEDKMNRTIKDMKAQLTVVQEELEKALKDAVKAQQDMRDAEIAERMKAEADQRAAEFFKRDDGMKRAMTQILSDKKANIEPVKRVVAPVKTKKAGKVKAVVFQSGAKKT